MLSRLTSGNLCNTDIKTKDSLVVIFVYWYQDKILTDGNLCNINIMTKDSLVVIFVILISRQSQWLRLRPWAWWVVDPRARRMLHSAWQLMLQWFEWMNENVYMEHKKLPHKTFCVHSARYTQCIHASSHKPKLPKDIHTNKVQTPTVWQTNADL